MKKIVAAIKTPMDAMRWLIELSCGHTIYETSRRKPRGKRTCFVAECQP